MRSSNKSDDRLGVPATDRRWDRAEMNHDPRFTPGSGESREPPEVLSTTEARQGAGPRSMVTVLFVSMALAATAGAFLVAWFLMNSPTDTAPGSEPVTQGPPRVAPR